MHLLWHDDGARLAASCSLKSVVACGFVRSYKNVDGVGGKGARFAEPHPGDGLERLGFGEVEDEEKDVGVGVR